VWWKYALAYGIQYIIMIVVLIVIMASMLNYEFISQIIDDPESFGQMVEQDPAQILNVFSDGDVDWVKIGLVGLVIVLVGLVMMAWLQNVYLKLNDSQIRHGHSSLSEALKNSFDNKMWLLLAVTLVMVVAFLGMYVIFIGAFMVHWSLAVIAFIGMFLVGLRFILAPAAIVHGDNTVSGSIQYSFDKITWKRSFLLLLLCLVAGIMIGIAAIIVFAILGFFLLIPLLGIVIYFAGSVLFYGLTNALVYSGISGLYFRYSDDSEEENESGMSLEDHLVTD
jgi:hypothetical protein